jgi:hypothetical protein
MLFARLSAPALALGICLFINCNLVATASPECETAAGIKYLDQHLAYNIPPRVRSNTLEKYARSVFACAHNDVSRKQNLEMLAAVYQLRDASELAWEGHERARATRLVRESISWLRSMHKSEFTPSELESWTEALQTAKWDLWGYWQNPY